MKDVQKYFTKTTLDAIGHNASVYCLTHDCVEIPAMPGSPARVVGGLLGRAPGGDSAKKQLWAACLAGHMRGPKKVHSGAKTGAR
eukprot:gene19002-25586_t